MASKNLSLFLFLLIVSIFILGCGGRPQAPTFSITNPYTPRVGEVWRFRDGYGNMMTITQEAAPSPAACRDGENIIWHFQKENAQSYWAVGVPEAELWFVLHKNADGSWRATESLIKFPESCPWCEGATQFKWQVLDNDSTMQPGYEIVPPPLEPGQIVTFDSRAVAAGGSDVPQDFSCIIPAGTVAHASDGAPFRTDFYIQPDPESPFGLVAVSNQKEACPGPCEHEQWAFAQDIGLVRLTIVDSGGIPVDPKLTMVRVQ